MLKIYLCFYYPDLLRPSPSIGKSGGKFFCRNKKGYIGVHAFEMPGLVWLCLVAQLKIFWQLLENRASKYIKIKFTKHTTNFETHTF